MPSHDYYPLIGLLRQQALAAGCKNAETLSRKQLLEFLEIPGPPPDETKPKSQKPRNSKAKL